jgi:hypothetical protein
VSEPQDRPREGGGEGGDPDAVPPWDPARAAGASTPTQHPAPGGWQSPGGSGHPGKPSATPGPTSGPAPGRPADPWGFGGPVAPPRPGIVPLRPLGLGELLDGAFQYIRAHPRVVLGISAVVAVVTVLLQAPFQSSFATSLEPLVAGGGTTPPRLDQLGGALGDVATLSGVNVLISLLGNTVLTGLLVVVLSRSVLGAPVVARDCWEAARPRLLGLLGVVVLVAVLTVLAFLVPLIPAGLLALLGAPAGAIATLALLGLLAGLALAVVVAVGLALAAPAYVLEGVPVIAALRRSPALVRGRFWPILGIIVLTAIIVTVVAGIIAVPFSVLSGGVGRAIGETNPFAPLPLLVTSIGAVIAGTLTSPFQAGVTGLLYIDQRMRREGFDIELQRAARAPG